MKKTKPTKTPTPKGVAKPTKTPDGRLALRWGCTKRTISNWRRAGAPLLGSDDEMLGWLGGQRTLPPATVEIMEAARLAAAAPPTEADMPQGEGAPAELARLAVATRLAARVYWDALKGGDGPHLRGARKNYTELALCLCRFDAQVTQERRTAGALIPRPQIEDFLRYFGATLRWTWHTVGERIARDFGMAGGDWPAVQQSVTEGFAQGFWATLAINKGRISREQPELSWIVDALADDTRNRNGSAIELLRRAAESLRPMLEAHASEVVQAQLKESADIKSGEFARRIREAQGCRCSWCQSGKPHPSTDNKS